jgi:hypothetical protein
MSRPRPKMVFDAPASPANPITGSNDPLPQPERKPQRSRIGRRAVTFYISQEAFKQLGILSAQTDRSIQDMMVDAVDWLFQSHGLARIAKE